MTKIILNIILIWVTIFLAPGTSYSQPKTYQFEQIDSLQKIEKKKIMVFIHTDWCKYCQAMINTTFKTNKIIEQINRDYYFIYLNAEEKKTIHFNGHVFKYKPTGINTGVNELAEQLGTVNDKIAYPTICFLNSNNEIIFQYPEYMKDTELMDILTRLK